MLDCQPPPAPLVRVVREATRVASHYITPLALPAVCLREMEDSGMATPGVVWFAAKRAAIYESDPATWSRWTVSVVLHEVLHQYAVADYWPHMTDDQRGIEEGIVSTVVRDLLPELENNIQHVEYQRSAGIEVIAGNYRGYAARVYQHGWCGCRGKAFRAAVLLASPGERDALINDRWGCIR